MTIYQLYTRFRHFWTAAHWHGYAVHSPMMYAFVREVVMRIPRRRLPEAVATRYGADRVVRCSSVAELAQAEACEMALLIEPFRTKAEEQEFREWYAAHHVVVAHFQGLIVLFFDPKLQKQYFRIRN